MLADATTAKNRIKQADVAGSTGFAPAIRVSMNRPANRDPANPGMAPATTSSNPRSKSAPRSREDVVPRAIRTPISWVR